MNALDGYGRAALHYAAERDELCVELLLSYEADPDIRDSNQDTPLHWAAYKNNYNCVRTLLQHGASVNPLDFNSDTPLSWASQKGNLESIQVLLEYNTRVDTKNYNGLSPLMRAAAVQATGLNTVKDDACLELLIKAHGQFELRADGGELPDHIVRDNRLREMLMPYCCTPRRLKELSRFAVRLYLGNSYLPNIVPSLPIPGEMKEFMLLER